jgi:hypothetical protein
MTEHKASCSCGQLTVTVEGEPEFVSMCHCAACQKRSGSPFGLAALFPRERVKIEGPYKSWSRIADSGKRMVNHFCPECGSNVVFEPEIRPGSVAVTIGSFEAAHFAAPTISFYTANKHDWVAVPQGTRVLEAGRAPPKS